MAAERQFPLNYNSGYFWFFILPSARELMARSPTVVALPHFQMIERNSYLRSRSFMECMGRTKPLTKAIQEVPVSKERACLELAKGLCNTEECSCNPVLSGDFSVQIRATSEDFYLVSTQSLESALRKNQENCLQNTSAEELLLAL